MRILKLSAIALVVFLGCLAAYDGNDAHALSRGPFLEFTAAPGENNCTKCHRTYPLDSGTGKVEIIGLPEQYVPSQTYPIKVRVTDEEAREWGFEITAITDDGAACGSFRSDQLAVQALGPSQQFGRFYALQTIFGVYAGQTGSAEWNFYWKAPSTDLGPATFYATGNGANGDHTDFFDYIYSTSITIDGQRRTVRVALLTPAGGERFGSGERSEIRWEATEGDGVSPASFRILLSTDGGGSYPTVIADGLPADARSYVWQIPETLATSAARIRVVGVDTEGREHAAASRANIEIRPLGLDRHTATALPSGAAARSAVWADVDNDGRADAVVARSAGGPLLLRQRANGTFEDVTEAAGLSAAGEVRAVAWADVDADGRPDLAVVTPTAISIYHLENTGVFSLVGAPTSLPRPAGATAAAWTDVDLDGRPDLLVATGDGLLAIRNAPEGFVDATAAWGAPAGAYETIAAGPLVALGGDGGVRVLRFVGGRLVDATTETGIPATGAVNALEWADLTGDGALDLLVGGASRLTLFAAVGGDGARYEDRTGELGLDGLTNVTSVTAGDFDADGRFDLALVAAGAPRVLHRGDTGFVDVTARFDVDEATVSSAWVDLDSTGTEDLVALTPTTALPLVNPRPGSSAVRLGGVAEGATVRVDLDGDSVWATGPKTARVARGGLVTFVNAPGAASVRVRVELPGGSGVETSVEVGGAPAAVTIPVAPEIASVRVVGAKLTLTGDPFPASSAIEVAGVRLAKVKVKGTKLVGRDPSLPSLVAARPVVVQVVDTATGAISAAVLFR